MTVSADLGWAPQARRAAFVSIRSELAPGDALEWWMSGGGDEACSVCATVLGTTPQAPPCTFAIIVLGCRGRLGVARLLLGSTTSRLLRSVRDGLSEGSSLSPQRAFFIARSSLRPPVPATEATSQQGCCALPGGAARRVAIAIPPHDDTHDGAASRAASLCAWAAANVLRPDDAVWVLHEVCVLAATAEEEAKGKHALTAVPASGAASPPDIRGSDRGALDAAMNALTGAGGGGGGGGSASPSRVLHLVSPPIVHALPAPPGRAPQRGARLAAWCEAHAPSLLVVGAGRTKHGGGGAPAAHPIERLLGTVAEHVVQRAPCPVIVVGERQM